MHLLCLVVSAALAVVSHGKCFGTQCEEEEASAKEHGLLGASMPACKARDRTFDYNPKWQVRRCCLFAVQPRSLFTRAPPGSCVGSPPLACTAQGAYDTSHASS